MLTLAAAAGTVLAIVSLWRLRRDYRVIEAAERFEAVNLSAVVQRYVPLELRTQRVVEEIAIAKQVIGTRQPRWKWIAIVSGMIMLCGATATSLFARRHLEALAAVRLAAKPTLNLDVLRVIEGVWGWQADFLQSCSENPQTVSVAADRKTLSVRYAKPFQDGSKSITNLDFDIVSARPDSLVLSEPGSATATDPRPAQVYIQFLDANSYSISRSDKPMASSGAIVRCPPSPVVDESVAH